MSSSTHTQAKPQIIGSSASPRNSLASTRSVIDKTEHSLGCTNPRSDSVGDREESDLTCTRTRSHSTQLQSSVQASANARREAAVPGPKDGTETNFQTRFRDKRSPAGASNQSNIIIFGETGVGKSSIINLIANKRLAKTSDSARGCTFQHEQYILSMGGVSCCLWDTTGLDEGTAGTVPAAQAESNLKMLIHTLSSAGGINLVIYCVRGGRLTSALRRNYDIFYSKVCRKKVPVALIVTHLEYQEGTMETWWDANEKDLLEQGMRFDTHACITTLSIPEPGVQARRSVSQQLLRNLIITYSKRPPWTIDESFMSLIFPMLRNLFRPAASSDTFGRKMARTVVVYDTAAAYSFESPPGIPTSWQRSTCLLGRQQYDFVRIGKLDASIELQGFAGLLIFYTSPLTDTGISATDEEALKKFYATAGGWMCPLLVVLKGCNDQAVAQSYWDTLYCRLGIHARPVVLPSEAHHPSDILMSMVETEWVEPPSLKSSKFQKAWTTIVGAVKGETQRPKQELGQITRPGEVTTTITHLNGQEYSKPDGSYVAISPDQESVQPNIPGDTILVDRTNQEQVDIIHLNGQGCPKSDDGGVSSSSGEENEALNVQSNALATE